MKIQVLFFITVIILACSLLNVHFYGKRLYFVAYTAYLDEVSHVTGYCTTQVTGVIKTEERFNLLIEEIQIDTGNSDCLSFIPTNVQNLGHVGYF